MSTEHEGFDADGSAFTVAVCTYQRPASLGRFLVSLRAQERPAALLVIDASDDDHSETTLREAECAGSLADHVTYLRVGPERRGVTAQRNLALSLTRTPLVAFFDDDVVLLPGCLAAMVSAHALGGALLVGVGAVIENEPPRRAIWRARRLLGVVPSLAPGRYYRSGVSTPWGRIAADAGLVEGDWLPGGATMWKTAAARAVGFEEALRGYGCSNDLAFSLRMADQGRQALCGAARVLHLHDAGGRPDMRVMGREAARSAHAIHRTFVPPTPSARLWFAWAAAADAILTGTGLLRPGRARVAAAQLRGVADYWLARDTATRLRARMRGR